MLSVFHSFIRDKILTSYKEEIYTIKTKCNYASKHTNSPNPLEYK